MSDSSEDCESDITHFTIDPLSPEIHSKEMYDLFTMSEKFDK
jgi:hypothetical protein